MNQDNNQEQVPQEIKEKTYCPRCGAEVNPKSRYCMKCGFLNKNHEENQGMKKYIKENHESYKVGSGKVIAGNEDRIRTTTATETGNKVLCFTLNYSLYIIIILFAALKYLPGRSFTVDSISSTPLPFIILLTTFIFLIVYAWQLIFIKCNRRWWIAFIPVYNIIVLSELVFDKPLLGLLSLVPVVNIFYMMKLFYELGQKFRKSGFLVVLFPYIMIPVMGFGTNFFAGINYIKDDKTLERDFLRKRIFLSSFTILSFLSIGVIAFGQKETIKQNIIYAKNYYYVYATNQIIDKKKKKMKIGYVSCDNTPFKKEEGTYYFYYADLSKRVFLIGDLMREAISAYVKVEVVNGEEKYYVSMSDGTYGFEETLYEDINSKIVKEYPELIREYDTSLECTLTY